MDDFKVFKELKQDFNDGSLSTSLSLSAYVGPIGLQPTYITNYML